MRALAAQQGKRFLKLKKKKWKMKRKDNDERKWKKENVVRYMWWWLKSEKGSFLEASLQTNIIKIIPIIYIYILLLLLSKFIFLNKYY